MATNVAQDAKKKGNEAFGAGDYPAAIGHYTSAIIADPNNPVFPLNRAAAYLKLGKYQDAERDGSTVIQLDARNPKAWYRRAQARQGLDKLDDAVTDLEHVLLLEPANGTVKQDIDRVQSLLANRKKTPKKTPLDIPSVSTDPPRRRRVPITIVDSDVPASTPQATTSESSSSDLMAPISTRKLNPSGSSAFSSTRPSQSTSSTPTPATRPGGGIFRRDGNHQLFGASDNDNMTAKESLNGSQANLNVDILPKDFAELSVKKTQAMPTNLYAFDRNWMALKTPQSQWQYLKQITPESLPSVFKTSLDTSLLISLIQTFYTLLKTPDSGVDPRAVKDYLVNLPRVPRWNTLLLLLGGAETAMIRQMWELLPHDVDDRNMKMLWGLQ